MSTSRLLSGIRPYEWVMWSVMLLWMCKDERWHPSRVRSWWLRSRLPVVDDTGRLKEVQSDVYVHLFEGVWVFEVPVVLYHSRIEVDKEGNSLGETFLGTEQSFQYYVWKEGNDIGIKYDSLSAEEGLVFAVDSFLNDRTITRFDQLYTQKQKNDSLVQRCVSEDSVLTETYVPIQKRDPSYVDTTILTFSRRPAGMEYSLSRWLDSARGLKLVSARLIYAHRPKATSAWERGPKQVVFELEEKVVADEAVIKNLVRKFNREMEGSRLW